MTRKEYNNSVDLYSDNLFRFIQKSIEDVEKAKDIVQESYAKLWMKHENVSVEKVKSYLFSTAYHTMIDGIRKEKKQAEFNEADFNRYSIDNAYSDLQEILHEALNKLPEVQKSVILLRDYEGYNYAEIGEITNLSEQQVKVYIFRGRKFLQKYIGSIEAVL